MTQTEALILSSILMRIQAKTTHETMSSNPFKWMCDMTKTKENSQWPKHGQNSYSERQASTGATLGHLLTAVAQSFGFKEMHRDRREKT